MTHANKVFWLASRLVAIFVVLFFAARRLRRDNLIARQISSGKFERIPGVKIAVPTKNSIQVRYEGIAAC